MAIRWNTSFSGCFNVLNSDVLAFDPLVTCKIAGKIQGDFSPIKYNVEVFQYDENNRHLFVQEFNMLTRSTIIILLNQTNEELLLGSRSQYLYNSRWKPGMEPPISILAGEYGVWASESETTGGGNKGSLQYSISGLDLQDPLILHWDNPYFGRNSYEPSKVPDGFELKVLGGEGVHATVAFVFSE
jgi:hypothetical protein